MTRRRPDLDALLSELDGDERDRLERVDAMLSAAGPPPELSTRLYTAPVVGGRRRPAAPARRAGRALALAAALAVTVFALGVLAGERLAGPGTWDEISLSGTAGSRDASATLEVFDLDDAGNWPMELRVRGLEPPAGEARYELWLTRGGALAKLCGSFLVEPDGTTVVPMNAPWRLDEFDGWVVVVENSRQPVLTTA